MVMTGSSPAKLGMLRKHRLTKRANSGKSAAKGLGKGIQYDLTNDLSYIMTYIYIIIYIDIIYRYYIHIIYNIIFVMIVSRCLTLIDGCKTCGATGQVNVGTWKK
jgi:hypothetical protein